jgi:hypothetical protein
MPCERLPLKWPYSCFRGGQMQGGRPAAALLPSWIPHAIWACIQDFDSSQTLQTPSEEELVSSTAMLTPSMETPFSEAHHSGMVSAEMRHEWYSNWAVFRSAVIDALSACWPSQIWQTAGRHCNFQNKFVFYSTTMWRL